MNKPLHCGSKSQTLTVVRVVQELCQTLVILVGLKNTDALVQIVPLAVTCRVN
uniref:Uncharacterized protein n=1 Tax=Anguilla anguilla TaxID=7936 RepID=A0A0E9W9Y2_ANGAN